MQDSSSSFSEATPALPDARRALIVDDSDLQRRILRSLMLKAGYEVQEAASGHDALQLCERYEPDLVLSDWMMPGMNGLEFCRRFRNLDRNGYGYFILLTAKRAKGDIAKGLDAGADDFLSKPVNREELRARISAGERILEMQRELRTKNQVISDTLQKLQKVYDSIDEDLRQARCIQQSLMPRRETEICGSMISTFLSPCGHVGGDLVGLFSVGEGRAGFYNIDVSGHGITSAMMTARIASYLSDRNHKHNLALNQRYEQFYAMRPPHEVAELLNDLLIADKGVNEYLTMAFASADLTTGRLKLVQAGHPPPLLLRQDGSAQFIGQGGMPIGLIEDATYETIDMRLEPGDRLLMYSDGFSECLASDGSMLGEDGLLGLAKKIKTNSQGAAFLDALYNRLCSFHTGAATFKDDVSAVLLEFQPK